MRTPYVKNLCRNNKRTTSAEDTQNQHYQRVLTTVDISRRDFPSLQETFPVSASVCQPTQIEDTAASREFREQGSRLYSGTRLLLLFPSAV